MKPALANVRLVELARRARNDGELVVAEARKDVPFDIVRLFTVSAPMGALRGEHAHRLCSQFMICVHGTVEVMCDDGTATSIYLLDRGNLGLVVPPGIWATQTYKTPGAVLAVLCDRPYEEAQYIRDYAEFIAWRGGDRHL